MIDGNFIKLEFFFLEILMLYGNIKVSYINSKSRVFGVLYLEPV